MNRSNFFAKAFELFFWAFSISIIGTSAIAYASQKPELFPQLGHLADVESVAFSPDGKYALSGSYDHSVRLWDVETGREVRTFKGHTIGLKSVAFSPDGRRALSSDSKGAVKLWDIATGEKITDLISHTASVNAVAFSPDGRRVLLGTYDGIMREGRGAMKLLDVATKKQIKVFTGSTMDEVCSVAFSPDGKYALSGSSKDGVRLWDVATGKLIRDFGGFARLADQLAFSPDGKYILHKVSGSNSLRLSDTESGREIKTFDTYSQGAASVAISRDGKYVLSGNSDGSLSLFDTMTGRRIRSFTGHSEPVVSVAISPDGRYALSGSDDDTLKLWDMNTGRKIRDLVGTTQEAFAVAVSHDGKRALTASHAKIRLWDLTTGRLTRILEGHTDTVLTVAFSSDGKHALSGSKDKTIKLWDVGTGNVIKTLRGHTGAVRSLAISPDGRSALSICSDQMLKLWNLSTGKSRTKKDVGGVFSIAYSPDGRCALLAGGSGGAKAILWLLDIGRGKRIRDFVGHTSTASSAAISSDGRYALSGSFDDTVRLWDMATAREIWTYKGHATGAFQMGDVESVAFSPDSRYAVSGSYDGTVRLIDVDTGQEARTFLGHTGGVKSVAFSPDGRHILSTGSDGTTRVWDITKDKDIATMVGFKDGEWATVTHDGYFVASKKGAEHINVSIGTKSYVIDNFFEKFYSPEIVAKVMSGKEVRVVADIRKMTSIPPEVRILSPKPGATFAKRAVTITVEAKDTGGGIDEIRLYQNHKLITEDQRGLAITAKKGHGIRKDYQVVLLAGENEFRAVALNKDRTESNPAIITIYSKAAVATADLYVIAVGINEYKNSRYRLNYGKPDATAFVAAVEQRGKGIFKNIHKQVLFDSDATRSSIEACFARIKAQAGPEDAFLFYYAGHGVMSEGNRTTMPDFFIVPYDVTRLYGDDQMLKSKGISAKRLKGLCTNISAQKQLIVLDACQSGGAIDSFTMRGAAEEKAILQLARSAGVVVLAATSTEQFASEVKKLGHGVFTYALLKGLEGEADGGSPPDKKITVKELEAFINDKVPELTEKYRGMAQYPNSFSAGQDFPLSIAR